MIPNIQYPPIRRGSIIVWGFLGFYPFGGMTWQVLHYLVGLRQLGFDVWYVEDSDRPTRDPDTLWRTADFTRNVNYLNEQMDAVALGDRWIFRPPGQWEYCLGAKDLGGLTQLYKEADAIINLGGAHYIRTEQRNIGPLIYLQTDPFEDQVRVANNDTKLINQLDAYDHFFSYGENLGAPDCIVPIERYHWVPTRPTVNTDWWMRKKAPSPEAKMTTISTWKNLGKDIDWQGEHYHWRKDLEFMRFIDLPLRSQLPLELALEGISAHESNELRQHGWHVVSAREINDPIRYHQYINNSLGEFTVAKDQYVRPRTGWFSDRSVCYLAAGLPVITQDTGFGKYVPTGEGLFAFETTDDALAAIDAIAVDYESNSKAAREIAKEYYDAEKVIDKMMKLIGL